MRTKGVALPLLLLELRVGERGMVGRRQRQLAEEMMR